MFGLNGNNEQKDNNKQAPSIISGLFKSKTQAVKMKILMALLPVFAHAFIVLIVILTVVAAFSSFTSIFSMFSGKDPQITSEKYSTKDGSDPVYDVNNSERLPGLEDANEIFESYDKPNTGLEHVKECKEDNSLGMWLSKLFHDNFQEACEMINYLQSKAKDLEDKYNYKKTGSDKFYLDRGLLISTFYYSYVWRDKDAEVGESKEENDVNIGSSDPLSIINYMIKGKDNQSKVKITPDTIDEMYKNQVLPLNYLDLSWKSIYTVEVGHYETKDGCTEGDDCKEWVHDYDENYYGCAYEKMGSDGKEYELDLNIYKIFLRDSEKVNGDYKLIGKIGTVETSNTSLKQTGSGYIGAKNFNKTVEATDGFCRAGTPVLGEHEFALTSTSAPESSETRIVTQNVKDYVTYITAQAFISDIESNKKNDYQLFLKKADYTTDDDDDLSFTYLGKNYEVDYTKGFINEKFSYMKNETQKKYIGKRTEEFMDVIFSNAETMNASMNFPYTSTVDDSLASNVTFVIGDEAAPLGDFEWKPSSDFGWRGAIAGTSYTGQNYHGGLDMIGVNEPILQKAIYAWKPGEVISAGYDSSCGNHVRIKHESIDGQSVSTLYCHMYTTPKVKVGDQVTAGQQIGIVGSTGNSSGPHLHFTVTVNGTNVHPCNYLTVGRTCKEANINGVIKNWP